MMNEHVQSIMTANPLTVSPKNKLSDVKAIFDKVRIHHVPVVNSQGELLGIVTTYDIWKLDLPFDKYDTVNVGDVMTTNLAKISPQDKIGTAAELFLDNRFHALPVVENGKLVGIVTSFDVLRYEFIREYDKPILYKDIYEKGLEIVV